MNIPLSKKEISKFFSNIKTFIELHKDMMIKQELIITIKRFKNDSFLNMECPIYPIFLIDCL